MLPSKPDPNAPPRADRRASLPASPRRRLARSLPWLFHPVRWFRQQLRRPLRIERHGIHVHILLGEVPRAPWAIDSDAGSGEALRHGHADLRKLLGRHPEAPTLFRHLAFVERALRKRGSSAIRELPLTVIHRGLAELNALGRDGRSEGLDELRRRLGHALEARTRGPDDSTERSADSEVDVSEASHSLFEEMERSWTGQVPQSGT